MSACARCGKPARKVWGYPLCTKHIPVKVLKSVKEYEAMVVALQGAERLACGDRARGSVTGMHSEGWAIWAGDLSTSDPGEGTEEERGARLREMQTLMRRIEMHPNNPKNIRTRQVARALEGDD